MPDLPFSFQNYKAPVDYSNSNGIEAVEPSKEYLDAFAKEQTESLPPDRASEAQLNLKQGDFTEYVNNATEPPSHICLIDNNRSRNFSPVREESALQQILMNADSGFPFNMFTDSMPEECGYGYKSLSLQTVTKMCTAMRQVASDKMASCHKSNCTTASFIGIIQLMKTRKDWDKKKHLFNCRPKRRFGKAYLEYIKADGLRKMFKKYNLGKTKRVKIRDLSKQVNNGWPKPGDPILVQRKNLSGHSAMFHSYKYKNNKINEVCFWSSNSRTRGQGLKCEKIRTLSFIDVAKVDNTFENDKEKYNANL